MSSTSRTCSYIKRLNLFPCRRRSRDRFEDCRRRLELRGSPPRSRRSIQWLHASPGRLPRAILQLESRVCTILSMSSPSQSILATQNNPRRAERVFGARTMSIMFTMCFVHLDDHYTYLLAQPNDEDIRHLKFTRTQPTSVDNQHRSKTCAPFPMTYLS